MKVKSIFPFLAVLVITACKNTNAGIQPIVGDITQSVYASGSVKAEGQYVVYSTVSGELRKINVEAGDIIVKEQSLFELDSDKARLNTENAQLTYELSNEKSSFIKNKIAELELAVLAARDKVSLDESVFKRNKNVINHGGITEVDFERSELAYKNSKLAYEAAQKRLEELRVQLKNEQERSKINLRLSQKNQSDFTIKSAFSGKLFDVLVDVGDFITPQTPLAVIGKADSFFVELDVDENDMALVKMKQEVLVTMDSYKGTVFKAVVSKIYPIMDERSRTFKIEAEFIQTPKKLYPNLTVETNIIIQTKKQAITIPKNYLVDKTYVLVEGKEKRKIKIGLSDYEKVEILEGLKAGETIYLPE
ncbi:MULTISPECIES: efflux RND transporter periplasmic adaptor subunit [Flavobacterium]|uniref:efflux RND transporter periplasmic adaptor subunit n=1 Tax=Flavobacterium TaxID=237 RepID=UPI001FCB8DB1|nr:MULTISPECIES: efflux RND transporter periplasmic adaptor subunit [Flavobacterium]UOK42009.1 efflux RND transporter periplasmic adaptor subunit [Flavobacterium enshiense]